MKTLRHVLFLLCLTAGSAIGQQAKTLSKDSFQHLDEKVENRLVLVPKGLVAKGVKKPPGTIRFDMSKAARIVTLPNGQEQVAPFVEVPLLFVKNTDEPLDAVSRENLDKVAAELRSRGGKGQQFSIAGHASAEGDPKRNRELSILRAARVQQELRDRGVAVGVITRTEGFGSDHAQFQDLTRASEAELQLDRRVLVVKER